MKNFNVLKGLSIILAGGLALSGLVAVGAVDPLDLAVRAKNALETRLTPGGKYKVHAMDRPRPRVVDPGTASTADKPGQPPSDAIVLFDGKDLSQWEGPGGAAPAWTVKDGYVEIPEDRKPGEWLISKAEFGDCQIHIEWATPAEVKGKGQGRGNSGVFLMGNGELQVLDSFQNDTYPDGQAGAFYGVYPPLVNASRKPGEWQSYDIILEMAKFDEGKKLVSPVRITVLHSGVVVHHAVDNGGRSTRGRLQLQDHLNPVRYRNIWVRPLKGYDIEK